MTPSAIPVVRRIVESLHVEEAQRMAGGTLRLATAGDVEHHLLDALAAVNRRTDAR